MSANMPLSVLVNNDISFQLQLTTLAAGTDNTVPLNITGMSLTFYIKASSTASDGTATTYTIGSGITVNTASLGLITVAIPHSQNTIVGSMWWRLDINNSGLITTAMYGPYYVLAV